MKCQPWKFLYDLREHLSGSGSTLTQRSVWWGFYSVIVVAAEDYSFEFMNTFRPGCAAAYIYEARERLRGSLLCHAIALLGAAQEFFFVH